MTSKERVQAALEFRETDCIPYDLGATTVSGIARIAYENAMAHRKLPTVFENMEELDPIQQIVEPAPDNISVLGIDTIRIGAPRLIGPEVKPSVMENGIFKLTDQFNCNWEFKPESDFYYNLSCSPLLKTTSLSELIRTYTFPNIADAEKDLELSLNKQINKLDDRAIVADRNCAGITEVAFRIRGYEQFFMDLVLDPEGAMKLMEGILQYKKDYWTWFASYAERKGILNEILVAVECDDLGTQDSLLCSPDMIKNMIMPLQADLVKHIKTLLPGTKVLYHSDGAIFDLIPDFIDMGIDILNPVQFTARGMELARLKKEYGKEIVFWGGGIDTQNTLPKGTPGEVADEVKRNIDILAPGGGFIFASVHNVQADVPAENFWAMWNALKDYR